MNTRPATRAARMCLARVMMFAGRALTEAALLAALGGDWLVRSSLRVAGITTRKGNG